MRVVRDGIWCKVCELTLNIELELLTSYEFTEGDNKDVIPTDSLKNTIHALAKQNEVSGYIDRFVLLSPMQNDYIFLRCNNTLNPSSFQATHLSLRVSYRHRPSALNLVNCNRRGLALCYTLSKTYRNRLSFI